MLASGGRPGTGSFVLFVFLTDYDPEVIREEFDRVERLRKPAEPRQVVGAVARLLTPR